MWLRQWSLLQIFANLLHILQTCQICLKKLKFNWKEKLLVVTKTSSALKQNLVFKLKEGGVVDPESKLVKNTHVSTTNGTVFSVVLSSVSSTDDRNSYYKIQILEEDTKQRLV